MCRTTVTVGGTCPTDDIVPDGIDQPNEGNGGPVKKVLAGIAFVALLIWAIRQLMPTKKPTEPDTEQGEPVNAG